MYPIELPSSGKDVQHLTIKTASLIKLFQVVFIQAMTINTTDKPKDLRAVF